jgi:DNA-directed RNA polymerase subunit beta'
VPSPRDLDLANRPIIGAITGHLRPVGALITLRDGQDLGVGEVLARIPQESQKTRDITGCLPWVAELFEARSPKDAGMLAEVTGTVSFGKDTKGKQRLVITDLDGNAHEFLIAKEKNVLVHDGHVVNKGEMIVDGPADPFAFASPGYRSSGPLASLTKCRTCIAYKA